MVNVWFSDEFGEWFEELDVPDQRAAVNVITKLEEIGMCLGYPHSSSIEGTSYPLRELRPNSGCSSLRIIYAFDPRREAMLLIGGDKSGNAQFYKRILPIAEKIWETYLAEIRSGIHRDEEER